MAAPRRIELRSPGRQPGIITTIRWGHGAEFLTRTDKTCRNICGIGRYIFGCEVTSKTLVSTSGNDPEFSLKDDELPIIRYG